MEQAVHAVAPLELVNEVPATQEVHVLSEVPQHPEDSYFPAVQTVQVEHTEFPVVAV